MPMLMYLNTFMKPFSVTMLRNNEYLSIASKLSQVRVDLLGSYCKSLVLKCCEWKMCSVVGVWPWKSTWCQE